ncbi:MAG TPA: PDZ domain-containing protein [Vicinamibacteria bacterium]
MRQLDRAKVMMGWVFAATVALGAGPAAAQDNAPIEVMVTSSIEASKGLSRILAGAAEGDTASTARDVEKALSALRWVRLVPIGGEAIVHVERRSRIESSRSRNKDGTESVTHRYNVHASVTVGDSRRSVDAETTRTYGANDTRDDATHFRSLAAEIAAKAAAEITSRLDDLRPDRPQHGFTHQPKYKLLFKGDGLEVVSVERGGPAEHAGLQSGDRIRRIGQEKGTDQMNAMVWEWWTATPGTRVTLEVERKKERAPFELTLLPREKWASLGSSRPRTAAAETRPAPAAQPLANTKARAADTGAASGGGSVELKKGMSEAEVVRALGQPRKKVTLGARTVWSYDGFSVTFTGGKVSDMN